jgi:hypothetical protein
MNETLLQASLEIAVPLWIERLNAKGGPDAEDFSRASEFGEVLASRGDVLLFRGGKKGESAELFNRTAEAIAVLSFLPGGVRLFGNHWESAHAGEWGE